MKKLTPAQRVQFLRRHPELVLLHAEGTLYVEARDDGVRCAELHRFGEMQVGYRWMRGDETVAPVLVLPTGGPVLFTTPRRRAAAL
jgi:hypothetical protein